MDTDEAPCPSHESPRPRKHRRDSTVNGLALDLVPVQAPAAKRTRRNNGTAAATTNGNHVKSGDAMDIDHYTTAKADSSKRDLPTATAQSPAGSVPAPANGSSIEVDGSDVDMDGEGDVDVDVDADADDDALQAQPAGTTTGSVTHVPTLTNGCSVGVQSDKVTELGPETTVLSVPDKSVTHAAWNPRDPAVLATGGDALCRIWTIANSRSALFSSDEATRYIDLLEASDTVAVSSMSWSPDGELLAIATHSLQQHGQGSVTIRSKAGVIQDEMPGANDLFLNLSWNPSGTILLGITHSSDGLDSTLVLWDIKNGQLMQPLEIDRVVSDVAWSDDRQFIVCGKDFIAESVIESQAITSMRSRDESDVRQKWTRIGYDNISRTRAIVAESTGTLALIDPSGHIRITTAHDAAITTLMYQPIPNPSAFSDLAPRLLATSSMDGTIKIWDVRRPFTIIHTLSLGHATPPLAMSFTPDGYLIAAASWNKIVIWNAELGGMPRASWKGKDGQWQVQPPHQTNGDTVHEGQDYPSARSLGWDADGGKLAYGLQNEVSLWWGSIYSELGTSDAHAVSQVAIINFRR